MSIRIGQGFDAHRFVDVAAPDAKIVLGGVEIPSEKALLAHSDGDVLLHALTDALLGALALGDIGKHFPDTDNKFKNADSRDLLRQAFQLLRERQCVLCNTDLTIIAQSPKMAPHIDAMRRNIAADLNTSMDNVSVKATTTEKMGFTGRGEGIAAMAVVLVEMTNA